MTQGTTDAGGFLQAAIQHHKAGQLEQAECLYRQVLDTGSQNGLALYGLGLIAIARHAYEQAIEALNMATAIDPDQPSFYNALGVALDNAGRPDEAIAAFRQATMLKPDFAEAYNNLAITLQAQGRLEQAIEVCRRAMMADAGFAKAYYTMGYCLAGLGKLEQAVEHYKKAIELDGSMVEAYNQLGVLLSQAGLYDQAIAYLQRAIGLAPDYAQAHNNLGIAFRARGDIDKAIGCYKEAIRLDPEFPEAYYNLANAYIQEGLFDPALDCCQKAIQLKPDYGQAYNQMGIALAEKGLYQQAIDLYRKAIELDASQAEFYNNIAICYRELAQYDLAVQNYLKAIEIEPTFAQAYCNLANAYREMGNCDKALECYDKAIALKGDYPDAQWNKAVVLLLKGQMKAGWQQYHWRYKAKLDTKLYPYQWSKPRWEGQSLSGKTILVHCEQGLGDAIQFARYVPMIRAFEPSRIILEAWPPLVRLFARIDGVDQVVKAHAKALEQHVDVVVSVMDLPAIFQTDLQTIPNKVPYLYPDQEQFKAWQDRLDRGSMNVGIVWAGRPTHGNDKNRSCNLEYFMPLTRIQGVRIYALQKGPASQQLARSGWPVENLADGFEDLMDAASCVAALDLVISVDTAMAHLAGALARPVWTLLPFAPDYRWMLDRADSPWYPTMRLFRQPRPRDWKGVFEQVRQQLSELTRSKASASTGR